MDYIAVFIGGMITMKFILWAWRDLSTRWRYNRFIDVLVQEAITAKRAAENKDA